MFIAKIEYIDDELNSEFDTILLSATDWIDAMTKIKECYGSDLAIIHYLEAWEDILIVNDYSINDLKRIKCMGKEDNECS